MSIECVGAYSRTLGMEDRTLNCAAEPIIENLEKAFGCSIWAGLPKLSREG